MPATRFKPEFKTRDGKRVSFGANYTHDTKAKRKAGLTKAGKPANKDTATSSTQRGRSWVVWALFGVNTAVIGSVIAVQQLGPVAGGLVIGCTSYVVYKVARWVVGQVAYWSVKLRQIRGGSRPVVVENIEPTAPIPGDTIGAKP